VSAISRAVATARAIADRCLAETGLAFLAAVVLLVVDEEVRFAVVRRVVSASAGTFPKLTRPTTRTLPIQKFDFLITLRTRGCKLLGAHGHSSKELVEGKRFIGSRQKSLTANPRHLSPYQILCHNEFRPKRRIDRRNRSIGSASGIPI
jgi:hypothetical protein